MNGEKCIGIIYMITNKTNLKSYVGQTRSFGIRNGMKVKIGVKGRWNQHCWKANNNQNDCPLISKAIRKYGRENFLVEEIYSCNMEELNEAETYFILLHETHTYGYNCTTGGDSPNFSEKQKIKMKEAISIKNKEHWKHRDLAVISKKISETTQAAMWRPEVRENLLNSVAKIKKSNLPSNIYERKVKGVVTGYEVKIKIRGKLHRAWFSSSRNSLKNNYELALNHLDQIKRNNF